LTLAPGHWPRAPQCECRTLRTSLERTNLIQQCAWAADQAIAVLNGKIESRSNFYGKSDANRRKRQSYRRLRVLRAAAAEANQTIARSKDAQSLALRTMLNGVSAARRKCLKPLSFTTFFRRTRRPARRARDRLSALWLAQQCLFLRASCGFEFGSSHIKRKCWITPLALSRVRYERRRCS